MKNIQEEVQKIHAQFGTSEMANYKIQLLFEEHCKIDLKNIEKLEKDLELAKNREVSLIAGTQRIMQHLKK